MKNRKHHYIIVSGFEDCCNLQCLSCKKDFINFDGLVYEYCPRCGVKFDGLFDKKNPRWATDKDRCDNSPYPKNEPYYVLERADPPYYTGSSPYSDWNLISHCKVGVLGLDSKWGRISSAAYFIRTYAEYKNKYVGTKTKVRLSIWKPEIKKLIVIKD